MAVSIPFQVTTLDNVIGCVLLVRKTVLLCMPYVTALPRIVRIEPGCNM